MSRWCSAPPVSRARLTRQPDGPARGDTEIEKYFDMSIVVMPFGAVLMAIGDSISGTETVTALMLAHRIR